jgi:hypothetical protein
VDSEDKEKLFERVESAFASYPIDTLERIHALQHSVYRSILANEGGNQFYTPHSGVRNRQNLEEEVLDISVSDIDYFTVLDIIADYHANA